MDGPTIVGLTGGIGSGKSTAAAMLADSGAHVVDADAIARSVTAAGGTAMNDIRSTLGAEFVDATGGLDRAAMRAAAFSNPGLRARLENIIHPLVRSAMEREIDIGRAKAAVVVMDVPLLFETMAYRDLLSLSVAVDCSHDTQIRRVAQRSGLSVTEIDNILAAQVSRPMRLQLADVVLCNNADLATLRRQVRVLLDRLGRSRTA